MSVHDEDVVDCLIQYLYTLDYTVPGSSGNSFMSFEDALEYLGVEQNLYREHPERIADYFEEAREDRPGDITEEAIATVGRTLKVHVHVRMRMTALADQYDMSALCSLAVARSKFTSAIESWDAEHLKEELNAAAIAQMTQVAFEDGVSPQIRAMMTAKLIELDVFACDHEDIFTALLDRTPELAKDMLLSLWDKVTRTEILPDGWLHFECSHCDTSFGFDDYYTNNTTMGTWSCPRCGENVYRRNALPTGSK